MIKRFTLAACAMLIVKSLTAQVDALNLVIVVDEEVVSTPVAIQVKSGELSEVITYYPGEICLDLSKLSDTVRIEFGYYSSQSKAHSDNDLVYLAEFDSKILDNKYLIMYFEVDKRRRLGRLAGIKSPLGGVYYH